MKKTLRLLAGVVLTLFVLLWCVSHFYYHRSLMATFSELAMIIIDRDKIYEEGDGYYENLEERAVQNLNDYVKPEQVKVDIPYHDTHVHGMQVFSFNEEVFTDTIILYVPGGGYLNNPLKYHWKIINKLSQETSTPIVMPIYLKVPNYTCKEAYEAMIDLYLDIASRENVKRIVLIGDSSGGAMSLVLAQIIRDLYPDVLQADDIILLAPWMDVSMDNEEILSIAPHDHMLGLFGTVDIGKKWAGDKDVHDPMVSPIYGDFHHLGRITIFVGTRDMLYPDAVKFSDLLFEMDINHTIVVEENLDHPYPLFPIPEATKAQNMIIDIINNEDHSDKNS